MTPVAYERKKARAQERERELSHAGRDIGDIPAVADGARKEACRRSFRRFCETYFPGKFRLAWSDDHLLALGLIERCILEGGLFALAMPRGSGKTTLCECAVEWALVYGHHAFVFLIGCSKPSATATLANIKTELLSNDLLLADFPEVCYPIRKLDGETRRAVGQLHHGERTRIVWNDDAIALPVIPGSRAAGAVVRVAGLEGNIRGALHTRHDGESVRPTLVILDDPQTDQSARSPSQCATRLRVINGAVLGLAGPGKKIAGIMPCTVVSQGDLADTLLDRETHPEWQGQRTKLIYDMPTNTGLWDEYARLRQEGLEVGEGLRRATKFYKANRALMDAGARPAWPARFNPDELSAVQHAMNLRLKDEAAFWAEYQNQPLVEDAALEELPSVDEICGRINHIARRLVPVEATRLTAMIDVQGKLLYWLVAAWEDDFTGYIIDYGTEPEQGAAYFTLRAAKRTLQQAADRGGLPAVIYSGLARLVQRLTGAEWRRDGGGVAQIDRILIDANWGASTDTVYQFARQGGFAGVVLPAHGRYVGATSVPFGEYRRKRGERVGLNWRLLATSGRRAVRHIVFDANWWKSFVVDRFETPLGDPGALTLYGDKPERHAMLADHIAAESRTRVEARGRTVDEWRLRQPGLDNHYLDCLVGAAVAASFEGAQLFGTQATKTGRRGPRLKLSEIQEARRAQARR